MPRRWKRKGQKYIPEIAILLRNAMPTCLEIKGEPDPTKREACRHECEIARDELLRMYRARERGDLPTLDFQVRNCCEQWIAQNGGRIPPPLNTGRPPDKHRRLLIAVHVKEAIGASGGKWGSVEAALQKVAGRERLSYDQVRDIHYDPDPEWRRAVAIELSWRKVRPVTAEQATSFWESWFTGCQ
jgi:hypothetical protein